MLLRYIMVPVESDYIERLILLFLIRLSGGQCTNENEAMPICWHYFFVFLTYCKHGNEESQNETFLNNVRHSDAEKKLNQNVKKKLFLKTVFGQFQQKTNNQFGVKFNEPREPINISLSTFLTIKYLDIKKTILQRN
jgi:hypothetical protein